EPVRNRKREHSTEQGKLAEKDLAVRRVEHPDNDPIRNQPLTSPDPINAATARYPIPENRIKIRSMSFGPTFRSVPR
ncbi:hypothetical protein ABTF80_21955, partial [Acinetobacter baumannii]